MNPSTTLASSARTSPPFSLTYRLGCAALLLTMEVLATSLLLDTQAIDGRSGLVGVLADLGPVILEGLVAFSALFVALGYVKARTEIDRLWTPIAAAPISLRFLVFHALALTALCVLAFQLFSGGIAGDSVVLALIAAGLSCAATAILLFIPYELLGALLRATGFSWIIAAGGAVAISYLTSLSRLLWKPATELTFQLVAALLSLSISDVVSDPQTRTIGTSVFRVEIAPACSGLEGLGLMAVFGLVWLWISRDHIIVRRAIWVMPLLVASIFPLNALRIVTLILIGNAGLGGMALGGFHSQAGWIVFNAVALGFTFLASRSRWLSVSERREPSVVTSTQRDQTPVYLLPFLAILGAGMVSSALSVDFEWLYPLRLVAAGAALFYFRREYRKLDFGFGWFAVVAGLFVFALWLGLDSLMGAQRSNEMPASLATSSLSTRYAWIAIRAIASVVTVPIAEELAFRGFLLRRLVSADFTSVSLQRCSWMAILVSPVAFGALHGDRWFAGAIAGAAYWFAARTTGRIGDAVAAHAVTNLMIAIWVIWGGQWSLW